MFDKYTDGESYDGKASANSILALIPEDMKDAEICLAAVNQYGPAQNPEAISYVPAVLKKDC
jgi:hypothetical protein